MIWTGSFREISVAIKRQLRDSEKSSSADRYHGPEAEFIVTLLVPIYTAIQNTFKSARTSDTLCYGY